VAMTYTLAPSTPLPSVAEQAIYPLRGESLDRCGV
jgi:hypothetical protein